MKLLNRLVILFIAIVVFQSCEKNIAGSSVAKEPVALVKSITWDMGTIHKLEFTYNADSTVMQFTSGSNDLPQQHNSIISYQNYKPAEVQRDGTTSARYTYKNDNVSQKSYLDAGGVENARFTYTYNSKGQVAELKQMSAVNGALSLKQVVIYQYDTNNGTLAQTQIKRYNEKGALTATVVRKYESWSAEVHIDPLALLHSLYQHQATEVFDDVVLSTLNKLPLKITETGNPETGNATYEYHIAQTGKRLDKLSCVINLGNVWYDTTEAIFHY